MYANTLHIDVVVKAILSLSYVIVVFWSNNLIAQQAISSAKIDIEHGLSNNMVSSIVQDNNGFMWFGSYDGLNRYDGLKFKVFRNQLNDTTSLIDNKIHAITKDLNNNLWIGTENGLNVFDQALQLFYRTYYIPIKQKNPQKLTKATYQLKTDQWGNVFAKVDADKLIFFEKGKKTGVEIHLPIEKYRSINMAYDRNNQTMWLFLDNKGLYKYNYSEKSVDFVTSQLKNSNFITIDQSRGSLYLLSGKHVFEYQPKFNTYKNLVSLPNAENIRLSVINKNELWIGTDGNGIIRYDLVTKKTKYFDLANEKDIFNSKVIYDITEDDQNNIWIATLRGGITKISTVKKHFLTLSHVANNPNSLINNFVLSFCEDKNNSIWIGTDGGGLSLWDRNNNSFTNYKASLAANGNTISSNFITSIKTDSTSVWLSTWNGGGINRFDKKTKKFKYYNYFNQKLNISSYNIWNLYIDKQNTLWASALDNGSGGIYYYNKKNDAFEIFDFNLPEILILTEDTKGNFWGGSKSSLIKIDRNSKKHKSYAVSNIIRTILEDQKGRLWIGTEGGGMLYFDPKHEKFKVYSTKDGLCNNSVLNILEDKQGNLWISTFNGLSKFNPHTETFITYTTSDGLQSNQFSYNAALKLKSGELLFGGIKGFTIFNPNQINQDHKIPQVFITDIHIGGKSINKKLNYVTEKSNNGVITALTIPYSEASLTLQFVSPEYTAGDKIKYAYYMDGLDRSWQYDVENTSINFTNLKEGSYTFNVKASNTDGVWSDHIQTLKITILPPWYRTWWAYSVYLLALSFAIFAYIRYREQKSKLIYEAAWARQETEKERELVEKKLDFFTHICHEFRTPLSLIIAPINLLRAREEQRQFSTELNVIYRNAKRLLSLTNQILLFRKVTSTNEDLKINRTNLIDIIDEVFVCFKQESIVRLIQYELYFSNDSIEIFVDVEKIEIVFFNLISNAFKFTPNGGKITIEIEQNENGLQISVADTGIGINKNIQVFEKYNQDSTLKVPNSGFGIGLYLVKKFLAQHKGTINYHSELGKGTTFYVNLPQSITQPIPGLSLPKDHKKSKFAIIEELTQEPELPQLIDQLSILNEQNEKIIQTSEKLTILLVDDDDEFLKYLQSIFIDQFIVFTADNANVAYDIALRQLPDIIISDIRMGDTNGIDLCKRLKSNAKSDNIPFILLTGSTSYESQLEGMESGADYYITKPYEADILIAQVDNILKSRDNLKKYFINSIILKENTAKVSPEYRDFLEKCIAIIEENIDNDNFSVKTFCKEIGMSHSKLYAKVKLISGQTITGFIRSIRLRRAAILILRDDFTITQAAFQVGISDIKYFRKEFNKLFGMNPSEYARKYKAHFNQDITVIKTNYTSS